MNKQVQTSALMPPKIAAITMVYNEPELLPVWARHYARQVGTDYCFVVDHGSTVPIIVPPGMNVLRLPRSPHDDRRRSEFIRDLAASLLTYFDWIIYSDVDELIVADPARYPTLPALCAATPLHTLTCIGLDVQHVPATEGDLDLTRAIGKQRRWARFTGAMCKPLLTRVSRDWSAGFHIADVPVEFDWLYLFHLHWADQALGLERLAKTRLMPWTDTAAGVHQRVTDQVWQTLFSGMAALPREADIQFSLAEGPLPIWLDRFKAARVNESKASSDAGLHLNAPVLWEIPQRLRNQL